MNKNILYNLPCVGGMKKHINDNTVDIIITDPPFAINFKADKKNYNRDKSKVIKEYNEVSPDQYSQFTLEWLTESKRILKENGSIYICSGWNYVDEISQSLKKLNFKIINHIIWKYSFGVYCKKRFVSSHFHILYACLNDKKRSEKFNTNCRYKDNDLIDKTKK